jgi:hypothetical protein
MVLGLLRSPLSEEIVIPSRYYAYILNPNAKPWGISANFLTDAPHLLALGTKIVVDKTAAEANERSANKIKWLSDKEFVQLIEKRVITKKDLRKKIVMAAQRNPELRDTVLAQVMKAIEKALTTKELYENVSQIDCDLSPFIAQSVSPDSDGYVFGKDDPVWMEHARTAFQVFFRDDFYLFPPFNLSKYPREQRRLVRKFYGKKLREINKLRAQISDKQLYPAKMLVTLGWDYERYQDTIYRLHGKLDPKIDDFQRSFMDPAGEFQGLDIKRKRDLLLKFRKTFGPEVAKVVHENRDKDLAIFKRDFQQLVNNQEHKLLSAYGKDGFSNSSLKFGVSQEISPRTKAYFEFGMDLTGYPRKLLARRKYRLGYARLWLREQVDEYRAKAQ